MNEDLTHDQRVMETLAVLVEGVLAGDTFPGDVADQYRTAFREGDVELQVVENEELGPAIRVIIDGHVLLDAPVSDLLAATPRLPGDDEIADPPPNVVN